MRCERHNFEYNESTLRGCPCCAMEVTPSNRVTTPVRPNVSVVPPVVTDNSINAPESQVQVALPLGPGAIIDDQVRQIVYEGIRADFQKLITKWGFKDYNVQLKWPDTDNHPTIEFFSAGFGYYQRFLGAMIDKCSTLRPSTKLKFIQALVAGLDRLGYFQELQTILSAYEFQRDGSGGGIREGEENPDDDD